MRLHLLGLPHTELNDRWSSSDDSGVSLLASNYVMDDHRGHAESFREVDLWYPRGMECAHLANDVVREFGRTGKCATPSASFGTELAFANTAEPSCRARGCDVGVLGGVFMATEAMGLPCPVSRDTRTSKRINSRRHCLHMGAVHAGSVETTVASRASRIVVVAPVVNLESIRDRPGLQFIGEKVCTFSSALYGEHAIAVRVFASEPRPAFVRTANVNLGPESFNRRNRRSTHGE